jgi:hypothetical protein
MVFAHKQALIWNRYYCYSAGISLKKGLQEKSTQPHLCDYVLPTRFSTRPTLVLKSQYSQPNTSVKKLKISKFHNVTSIVIHEEILHDAICLLQGPHYVLALKTRPKMLTVNKRPSSPQPVKELMF